MRGKKIPEYYIWLIDPIFITDRTKILERLFETAFYWSSEVPFDKNRNGDGLYLREDYVEEFDTSPLLPKTLEIDQCSLLEVLISLAKKIDSELLYSNSHNKNISDRFWMLIKNLGLYRYSNKNFNKVKVDSIIFRLLDREYEYNGEGGLFPLKNPKEDQRKIDLWRQAGAYVMENYFS